MKHLVLPILLSLTLIACNGSSAGGSTASDNTGTDPVTDPKTDPVTDPKTDPVEKTCATDITLCLESVTHIFSFTETLGTITVAPESQTTTTAYSETSLTAAATANSNIITLPAIAVLFNNSTSYKREASTVDWNNSEDRGIITTPNATLSRTSLDVSAKYPTVQLTLDGSAFTAEIYADDTYSNLTADTSSTFFGFTATNMAFVEWSDSPTPAFDLSTQTGDLATDYSKQGMLIAGIATTDFTMLDGATQFTGKGKGEYGVLQADKSFTPYDTTFSTRINVDFVSKMLDFYSYGTACDSCTLPADTDLNLTATGLSFADAVGNNLSTNTASAGTLTGTLDARFYGNVGDGANEFGGTFALTDNASYYYGAFGAEIGDWFVFTNQVTTADAGEMIGDYTVPTANKEGVANTTDLTLTSFTDTDANKGKTNITLPASMVYLQRVTGNTKTITNNIFENSATNKAVLQFSYDSAGQFFANKDNDGDNDKTNDNHVALYFGDKRYGITIGTNAGNAIAIDGDNFASSDNVFILNFEMINANSDSVFGFATDYMVNISWNATGGRLGMGVAGFETETLLTAGATRFTGRGRGAYASSSSSPLTSVRYFAITADIDFFERSVVLESRNTCSNIDNCSGTLIPELDFKGTLEYAEGINAISGTIATKATSTAGSALTGKAFAKFYGGDTQEFGGTFSLQNASSESYIGFFGGVRGDYLIFSNDDVTTDAVITDSTDSSITYNTPTIDKQDLTGLNDSNRASKTITLPASIVYIRRDTTAKTITNTIVENSADNNAVLEFSYDADGKLFANSNNPAALYFDDKRYAVTDSSANDNYIESAFSGDSSDGGILTVLSFSKSSNNFDFATEYMIRIHWEGVIGLTDNISGSGVAGFETIGSAIPTSSSASFTGKGSGNDYDEGNSANRYFDIDADIDFSNRTVALESRNTCSNPNNCSGTLKPEHDFKGTLSYEAGTNAITGNIIAKGNDDSFDSDDGTQLTGTANAKFYGIVTDGAPAELGGTFSMQHPSGEGYIGFFGATK